MKLFLQWTVTIMVYAAELWVIIAFIRFQIRRANRPIEPRDNWRWRQFLHWMNR